MCGSPPRGSDMGGNGRAANGRETTRQGIWAGAAQISCDPHNCQLLSSRKKKRNEACKLKKGRNIPKFHMMFKHALMKGTGTH